MRNVKSNMQGADSWLSGNQNDSRRLRIRGPCRAAGIYPAYKKKKPEGGGHLPAISMTFCMSCLFVDHEFSPSVLGPGLFVISLNRGLFLAIADDGKALRLNTQGEEILQG